MEDQKDTQPTPQSDEPKAPVDPKDNKSDDKGKSRADEAAEIQKKMKEKGDDEGCVFC